MSALTGCADDAQLPSVLIPCDVTQDWMDEMRWLFYSTLHGYSTAFFYMVNAGFTSCLEFS